MLGTPDDFLIAFEYYEFAISLSTLTTRRIMCILGINYLSSKLLTVESLILSRSRILDSQGEGGGGCTKTLNPGIPVGE
jgi:hypothetical protein